MVKKEKKIRLINVYVQIKLICILIFGTYNATRGLLNDCKLQKIFSFKGALPPWTPTGALPLDPNGGLGGPHTPAWIPGIFISLCSHPWTSHQLKVWDAVLFLWLPRVS